MARAAIDVTTEKEISERRERAAAERQKATAARQSRETLRSRLDNLASELGSQEAGYRFQDWFYDLAAFEEIDLRRPYVSAGRQIDGILTVDGTTYLVELRFRQEPSGGPDIDGLLTKVNSKADNTMGLFISASGFNAGALQTASFAKTPLLLLDCPHLYHILSGLMTLSEVIQRVRRHASQTGDAFLSVVNFSGQN